MDVSLAPQMRQQLAMTPEFQRSIAMLQLSGIEFEQAIEEALVTNPFLEREDAADYSVCDPAEAGSTLNRETLSSGAEIADEQSAQDFEHQSPNGDGDNLEREVSVSDGARVAFVTTVKMLNRVAIPPAKRPCPMICCCKFELAGWTSVIAN